MRLEFQIWFVNLKFLGFDVAIEKVGIYLILQCASVI